jgi:hypothetical protein
LATPDLVDLAQQAPEEASLQAPAVDYQQAPEEASLQAQVADYQLVLVAGYQQAQVADYQLVLVAGYQQAQVVDFLPGRVEVSQLAPAVDYQQVLATIGAVCLALIMAGKESNRSNIHRRGMSTSKDNEKRDKAIFS